MPRSTRAGLRNVTASQERSQSVDGVIQNHIQESFISVSTASLPTRYTISIAVDPTAASSDRGTEQQQYVRGAEVLADGNRKAGDEGRLSDLRACRIRHVAVPSFTGELVPSALTQGDRHVLLDPKLVWYTAGYSHPCICQLVPVPYAWSPAFTPPAIADLTSLPDQNVNLVPLVGSQIPEWASNPVEDLDSAQDDLEEFEFAWRSANGSGWGSRPESGDRSGCDDVHEGVDDEESLLLTAEEESEIRSRKKRKGKDKEVSEHDHSRSAPGTEYGHDAVPSISSGLVPVPGLNWEEEAKKRKSWWRNEIRQGEWYGQLTTIIPRPHSFEPRAKMPGVKKSGVPPDYVLPRYYTISRDHPFHPNLRTYIGENPSARVYWVIPICGPVNIPGYADRITGTRPPFSSAPIPSSGVLGKVPVLGKRSRPVDLNWTPEILSHFWASFLIPLHADTSLPFGSISVRISGPKPDPFLSLKSSPPLPPWAEDPSRCPVRPEMGDHIRIYVNAKYALAIRTWLNGIEVDFESLRKALDVSQGHLSNDMTGQSININIYRPFEKVRLALMGMKGEALIVA